MVGGGIVATGAATVILAKIVPGSYIRRFCRTIMRHRTIASATLRGAGDKTECANLARFSIPISGYVYSCSCCGSPHLGSSQSSEATLASVGGSRAQRLSRVRNGAIPGSCFAYGSAKLQAVESPVSKPSAKICA